MTSTSQRLGPLLQAFFAEHLIKHKRVSMHTIAAYRDAFRLLLVFRRETTGTDPAALSLGDLDAPRILAFSTTSRRSVITVPDLEMPDWQPFVSFSALWQLGSQKVLRLQVASLPFQQNELSVRWSASSHARRLKRFSPHPTEQLGQDDVTTPYC